jgi:AcrR family transcriptional regulator
MSDNSERLVNAALALLREGGTQNIQMRKTAERARLSHQTAYVYIPGGVSQLVEFTHAEARRRNDQRALAWMELESTSSE